MDRLSNSARSALMGRIRSKDTAPEMAVRRLVHGLGFRYVPNDRRLPGTPDLAFISRRKAIFVHGCFWHAHDCGRGFKPTANRDFWQAKLQRNVERDRQAVRDLQAQGWRTLTVFECEVKPCTLDTLSWTLIAFLEGGDAERSEAGGVPVY